MWLLNSCSWEMKEFVSRQQAPPYAILSHTWGDEEVSFRDWHKESWGDVERNEGFSKIRNCCRQAAADGFEWVWIDTCCIDKRSSAELSEAINSMFQWYKNAGVCYAYLYDVPDNIELNLAGSRWITRGWTLQELIAPREVIFYSSDWKTLGTRSELSALLATVTRIKESFLVGKSRIDEASIAQRMSWASMRRTSREEDEAYCLLGLFNVNMPLIYGEGPKAFRRLQEALVREYPEDHSIFAWGKIVKQFLDQVNDEEVWGPRPLGREDNPGEAENELFGLFAKNPDDFKDAGEIVCAPDVRYYFELVPITVSVLAGRTARVNLPKLGGHWIVKRLKRPPVVQLFTTRVIVLLCGQWNNSRTDFHYIAIPALEDNLRYSRFEQIILSDTYTDQKFGTWSVNKAVQTYTITPMLLRSSVRSGEIIIRRNISQLGCHNMVGPEVTISPSRGSIEIADPTEGIVTSASFEDSEGYGFLISTIRLGGLDHSHEDSFDGRNCGRLGFRFHPFAILGKRVREFPVLVKEGDSMKPLDKERMNSRFFRDIEEARYYGYKDWRDMACGYDMVATRDEWKLSIIGLADVYISVERMFLDEYDVDDDSDYDESHPFVDVLDLVVTKNRNEYNTVEVNRGDDSRVGGVNDEEEVDTKTIGDGNVDD